MGQRVYIAIDLKSFFASVECVERGLDPLGVNLVVADQSRSEKTICLAVSPSLKRQGISGRPRLFEVAQQVAQANGRRQLAAPRQQFTGKSYVDAQLRLHPELAIDYLVAPPRMAKYIDYSTRIYQVYLKYIAPEDIHVYSIDEVMMDVTAYLPAYGLSPQELAQRIILDVLETTGITATAGIGPNLYLCKVAMDIVAKHLPPDENGVRIAQLDEMTYRRCLWTHRPLTDFWRIGPGYARKLEKHGLYTMGDIARCSLGRPGEFHCEDLLYRLFGVNAQLLIDHAWGFESCTLPDIKAYRPSSSSLGSGQVLPCAYSFDKARIVVREMADALALALTEQQLAADQILLTVGYDRESLASPGYHGPLIQDSYGRSLPKQAHGSENLSRYTASARQICQAAMAIFHRVVDPNLLIRRLNICACHLIPSSQIPKDTYVQLDLFQPPPKPDPEQEREQRRQQAILSIQKKYGKNALVKGMSLMEGATARERNQQIGGHKA